MASPLLVALQQDPAAAKLAASPAPAPAQAASGGLLQALADAIRDSSLGQAMFAKRYGEDQSQQPANLAAAHATDVGYPAVGASNDIGEAQRYFATKQFVKAHPTVGAPVATAASRLHEALLSWLPGLDEGGPNLRRIDAGDRGIQQALSELAQSK